MSISSEISRLAGLRNGIRTKLLDLEIIDDSSADLEDLKTAIDGIQILTPSQIEAAVGDGWAYSSGLPGSAMNWNVFKRNLNLGFAPVYYPVGTQIMDNWAKTSSASYSAPWDIVHYDSNGNVELNWHYAIPDGIPFDAPEAIYFAPEGGLAAGTYYITIGTGYGDGWIKDATIYFTLNSAMEEGDQLFINCAANNANNPGNGRAWNVYAKGSTVSKQNGTTATSGTGTSLGTIGNVNAHRTNGNLNAISRVVYGYGRWKESAIRQWLNSEGAAGNWWTAQNPWDRPPSEHGSLRGFLAGYDTDFLNILEPVDVITALNTQEGFSSNTETTQDRIYLPCMENWHINPQYAGEGNEWSYYRALAQEAGLSGKFQQYQTYEILKKYRVDNTSSSVVVWLRSCYRGYATYAWYVVSSGSVYYLSAYYAISCCPACKIKRNIL